MNELNNYTYTEIGELKSDAAEEIEEIIWRVDSKIREMIRTSSSVKENLKFEYDAMGNRIAKHVYDELGVLQHSTFYVRDAQGNVMAVYEQEVTAPEEGGPPTTSSISYHLTERHIYGSARLGMDRTMVEMAPTLIQAYPLEPTIPATEESERYLGRKYYELSNHLGNVLTVITDEKRMILDGNNYSHYESVVVSVTDYSPFGVSLTGRTFTTTEGYRYGFNGMESDPEHNSGAYDFGARIMDARLGRWMSVDKKASSYAQFAPYLFSVNSPLFFVDVDGNDIIGWGVLKKNTTYGFAATVCNSSKNFMSVLARFQDVTNGITVVKNHKSGDRGVSGELSQVKLEFEANSAPSSQSANTSRGSTTLKWNESIPLEELTLSDFSIIIDLNDTGLSSEDVSIQMVTLSHEITTHLMQFSELLIRFKSGELTAEQLISESKAVADSDHDAIGAGSANLFNSTNSEILDILNNYENTTQFSVPTGIDTSMRNVKNEQSSFTWMVEKDVLDIIATYKNIGIDLLEKDKIFQMSKGLNVSLTNRFRMDLKTHQEHYKNE